MHKHAQAATPLLVATQLSLQRAGRYLWQDVTVQINPGDLCVIRGANGSGKTSLLKVLARLLPPSEGQVVCHAPSIGYIGHSLGLYPMLSAERYLQLQAIAAGKAPTAATEQMNLWGVAARTDLPLAKLSFGQQRRTALARLGLYSAALWLLDEPTAGLDAGAMTLLWQVIAAHQHQGGAVIMASHQDVPLPQQQQIQCHG